MVDMAMFQGAISGLKTAADLAIGLSKLNTMAEVQGKAIELQQIILSAQGSALSAQSEQFALVEKIRALEKEIADIKAWEETKQRYQLVQVWNGFFVYALKEQSKGTEPPHWICAKCYEDGSRAILQNVQYYDKRIIHAAKCDKCKSEIEHRGSTERKYA